MDLSKPLIISNSGNIRQCLGNIVFHKYNDTSSYESDLKTTFADILI